MPSAVNWLAIIFPGKAQNQLKEFFKILQTNNQCDNVECTLEDFQTYSFKIEAVLERGLKTKLGECGLRL